MQFGIIVIGYNRKKPLVRLLQRLNECFYDEKVLLIISIDHSGTDEIHKLAKEFMWKYGEKKVIAYPKQLGLRRHILLCGSYMEKYDLDAVAVFEDDIYPAECFYSYMKQAVDFYAEDDRIAGISLYTHLWNVHKGLPFQPISSPYDVFFMQFAQSWGQVWMRRQWEDFVKWYERNADEFPQEACIPENVRHWSSTTSWLKHHIRYCIENDKYFVYPYCPLSTCFSEAGEHTGAKQNHLQVPLQTGNGRRYCFPDLDDKNARHYDSFFENADLSGDPEKDDLCIDLYGLKSNHNRCRYWLTTKILDYEIVESYALELKPHELNYMYRIPGYDIWLYDTKKPVRNKEKKKRAISEWEYYYRQVSPATVSMKKWLQIYAGKVKRRLKNFCLK